WGRADLVRLFLERGADPLEKDAEPWATPLVRGRRRRAILLCSLYCRHTSGSALAAWPYSTSTATSRASRTALHAWLLPLPARQDRIGGERLGQSQAAGNDESGNPGARRGQIRNRRSRLRLSDLPPLDAV